MGVGKGNEQSLFGERIVCISQNSDTKDPWITIYFGDKLTFMKCRINFSIFSKMLYHSLVGN